MSKTKIFLSIEGILRLIEWLSPTFNHPIFFPSELHKCLYALAGVAYAERQIAPPLLSAKP